MFDFILYHTPFFYLIQSLWRDEAFSYFMASPNPFRIIVNTANDFNPPLYYLLLHFWMIPFGGSDEALRILSLLFHLCGVYFVYKLAVRISGWRFALFIALFTLLNPMLVYYAFEIRMYSLYALFVILSIYFLYTRNWKWYTISSALGLYSHTFFILVPFSYTAYFLLIKNLDRKMFFRIFKPVLLFLPWIPVIINQFFQTKDSWIFPVDWQLIKSVLGNLFTSFEGTPANGWTLTCGLSVLILVFLAFSAGKNRKLSLPVLTSIFVPLVIILVFSFKKSVYVNRYMIFITVFEIIGISLGLLAIKNRFLRYFFSFCWLTVAVATNIVLPPFHKKTDFKTAFMEINRMAEPNDFVYAQTPIGFLESAYYFKNRNNVFVHNPDRISIPNYIGVNVIFPEISKEAFPASSRVFLVADDAGYEIIIHK